MSIKVTIENIITALRTKDLKFTFLVALDTLVNSPSTTTIFPSNLKKKVALALDNYIKFKNLTIKIDNIYFKIYDGACFRVLQSAFEKSVQKIIDGENPQNFTDVGAHIGKYTLH